MIAVLLGLVALGSAEETAPLPPQEIAAVFTNDDEIYLSEMALLKNRLAALQEQFAALQEQLDILAVRDKSAKATFKKILIGMKAKMADLSEKLETLAQENEAIAALSEKLENLAHENREIAANIVHIKNSQTKPEPPPLAPESPEWSPPRKECVGLSFLGEWLYWKTVQGGMQYATRYNNVIGDMVNARARSVHFGYDSGFRVGALYGIPRDHWDIGGSYMLFSPYQTDATSGTLYPYLMYQGNVPHATQTVNEASAAWNIRCQMWDLEFGRTFSSCAFSLRPHAGVAEAWIHQHAQITYTGDPLVPTYLAIIDLYDKFSGFGLKGGLDSDWKLGWGVDLFGKFSASLFWGEFNSRQTQLLSGVYEIGLCDTFHTMTPMVDAQLGLSWKYCGCKKPFYFGVHAAIETQYWWEQNLVERFTSTVDPLSVKAIYDLAFYGLTLGAQIGF